MGRRCKVLIVDDSHAVCSFLEMILSQDPALEVVGSAHDPYEARDLIKKRMPDVLTLDVEMPRMDGITFLKNLMRLRPMPVVMLSSLTSAGAEITLDALAIGAVDFVLKQQPTDADEMARYAQDIRNRVRNAGLSAARPKPRAPTVQLSAQHSAQHSALAARSRAAPAASSAVHRVIAVGASTGGPVAVMELLKDLRLDNACAVLSQHMPPHFMNAYAERLDRNGQAPVVIAKDGDVLRSGIVYVAPGDQHLLVQRNSGVLSLATSDAPRVNDHRPAVDVMFESVANTVGASAIGVLLTGMGQDGANGMCRIRNCGGVTFAQDEASSVVWGMPGSAVRAGGVDAVEPLGTIATLVNELARAQASTVLNSNRPPGGVAVS